MFELDDRLVVLKVILDVIVDVWNLTDVKETLLGVKVFDQLAPATRHQLPRLAVVQLLIYTKSNASSASIICCYGTSSFTRSSTIHSHKVQQVFNVNLSRTARLA